VLQNKALLALFAVIILTVIAVGIYLSVRRHWRVLFILLHLRRAERYHWCSRCWNYPYKLCQWMCCAEEDEFEPIMLTLWCPLLPYGYSYNASCARLG